MHQRYNEMEREEKEKKNVQEDTRTVAEYAMNKSNCPVDKLKL